MGKIILFLKKHTMAGIYCGFLGILITRAYEYIEGIGFFGVIQFLADFFSAGLTTHTSVVGSVIGFVLLLVAIVRRGFPVAMAFQTLAAAMAITTLLHIAGKLIVNTYQASAGAINSTLILDVSGSQVVMLMSLSFMILTLAFQLTKLWATDVKHGDG